MTEERFKPLELDEMTPEMRQAAEQIIAGPRKGMRGPFKAMLRSPRLADQLQRVGAVVRFENSLPDRLKELAIIVTARHWTAQFEWWAHRRLALEAGLDPAICDAVAAGRRPAKLAEDEAAVYDFASSLLAAGQVSDAQFKAVADRFGERGVIDLVGTIGYYCTVALILNVDRYPLPPEATPLPPLAGRGAQSST
jgi:4-carboxymuconolactone decarboxylase